MTKVDKLKTSFEQIRSERPNTNIGVIHKVFGWICRILGWLFFIIGVGLILATAFSYKLFKLADIDDYISSIQEAYERLVIILQGTLGAACLLSGIVLLIMAALCSHVIKRNIYIFRLEELLETN